MKGVVLPAGGHAVYINMDEFFDGKRDHTTFAGAGFSLELIRRYGIRVSELGDFSMEYDLKTPEQQAELPTWSASRSTAAPDQGAPGLCYCRCGAAVQGP